MGVPISIVIDDYLPTNTGASAVAFYDLAKELWPVLVEKAFSKLNGNYYSIANGGNPLDAA